MAPPQTGHPKRICWASVSFRFVRKESQIIAVSQSDFFRVLKVSEKCLFVCF